MTGGPGEVPGRLLYTGGICLHEIKKKKTRRLGPRLNPPDDDPWV